MFVLVCAFTVCVHVDVCVCICAGVSCVQFDDTRIVSGSSDKTIKVVVLVIVVIT